MKGKLSKSKGTLIEIFIEFENGQLLVIQPLFNDASLVLFDTKSVENINSKVEIKENEIAVLNHNGEIVANYSIDSKIIGITHTVLYTDGTVWTGQILEKQENDISYFILTNEALSLLKDNSAMNFEADNEDAVPTVLVVFKNSSVEPKCGSHHCGRICHKMDKFILNGLSNKIV